MDQTKKFLFDHNYPMQARIFVAVVLGGLVYGFFNSIAMRNGFSGAASILVPLVPSLIVAHLPLVYIDTFIDKSSWSVSRLYLLYNRFEIGHTESSLDSDEFPVAISFRTSRKGRETWMLVLNCEHDKRITIKRANTRHDLLAEFETLKAWFKH